MDELRWDLFRDVRSSELVVKKRRGGEEPRKSDPEKAARRMAGQANSYDRSRSHDAVIRVYDDAGSVIAMYAHAGEFKES